MQPRPPPIPKKKRKKKNIKNYRRIKNTTNLNKIKQNMFAIIAKVEYKDYTYMYIFSVAGLRGSGFLGQRMAVTVNKATSIYSKTIRDGLLGR